MPFVLNLRHYTTDAWATTSDEKESTRGDAGRRGVGVDREGVCGDADNAAGCTPPAGTTNDNGNEFSCAVVTQPPRTPGTIRRDYFFDASSSSSSSAASASEEGDGGMHVRNGVDSADDKAETTAGTAVTAGEEEEEEVGPSIYTATTRLDFPVFTSFTASKNACVCLESSLKLSA